MAARAVTAMFHGTTLPSPAVDLVLPGNEGADIGRVQSQLVEDDRTARSHDRRRTSNVDCPLPDIPERNSFAWDWKTFGKVGITQSMNCW
jgi:hypothetical protein